MTNCLPSWRYKGRHTLGKVRWLCMIWYRSKNTSLRYQEIHQKRQLVYITIPLLEVLNVICWRSIIAQPFYNAGIGKVIVQKDTHFALSDGHALLKMRQEHREPKFILEIWSDQGLNNEYAFSSGHSQWLYPPFYENEVLADRITHKTIAEKVK